MPIVILLAVRRIFMDAEKVGRRIQMEFMIDELSTK